MPTILQTLRRIERSVRDDVSLQDFAKVLVSAISTLILLRAAAHRALLEFEAEKTDLIRPRSLARKSPETQTGERRRRAGRRAAGTSPIGVRH